MKAKFTVSLMLTMTVLISPLSALAAEDQINSGTLEAYRTKKDEISKQIKQSENSIIENKNALQNKIEAAKTGQQSFEQTIQTKRNNLQTHVDAIHQNTKTMKQDIKTIKSDIKTIKNDRSVTNDFTEKAKQPFIQINIDSKPINVSHEWLDITSVNKIKQLNEKLNSHRINMKEHKKNIRDILNKKLQNYIQLHENHFKLLALLQAGFTYDTLTPDIAKKIKALQSEFELGNISEHDLNSGALDLLKAHLKERGDKLEQLNNNLPREDSISNISENFVDNFNKDKPNHSSLASEKSNEVKQATLSIPNTGEQQNKPLLIAGIIILVIGLLIFIRNKKK